VRIGRLREQEDFGPGDGYEDHAGRMIVAVLKDNDLSPKQKREKVLQCLGMLDAGKDVEEGEEENPNRYATESRRTARDAWGVRLTETRRRLQRTIAKMDTDEQLRWLLS
jgi:hypothetical protein